MVSLVTRPQMRSLVCPDDGRTAKPEAELGDSGLFHSASSPYGLEIDSAASWPSGPGALVHRQRRREARHRILVVLVLLYAQRVHEVLCVALIL